MELGVTTMNTAADPPPHVLARRLEDAGYDSWWIGEHSHIPSSRATPYPAGGEMPEPYKHMMDPFVSLAMAATATDRLLLATGVALPLERDIFTLAKTVASLDVLSEGRMIFGVGVGWNEEEFADHRSDIPWGKRYGALTEAMAALGALWTEAEASFAGQWYEFAGAWSFPKPVQTPHPPIYCGTAGPVGTAQAVEWGDGWLPMDVALGDVATRVARFRADVADAGRTDVPITLVVFGDPDPERLREYRDLGIERAVIGAGRTGWDDPSTLGPFLDRHAGLISALH